MNSSKNSGRLPHAGADMDREEDVFPQPLVPRWPFSSHFLRRTLDQDGEPRPPARGPAGSW